MLTRNVAHLAIAARLPGANKTSLADRIFLSFVLAALFSFAMPNPAAACACCAEIGDRREWTREIDEFTRLEIQRLRFDDKTELYGVRESPDRVAARDFFSSEDISGNFTLNYHPLEFRTIARPKGWRFEITNHEGKRGLISFTLPPQLVEFKLDPRDGARDPRGVGPRLYLEWRLEGTATLSSIIGDDNVQAKAILIVQGHGNNCPSTENFTHWRLSIESPDTRFTVMGKFIRFEKFRVHRVADDDVLNMRAGPGTNHPVVAEIPHNSDGIKVSSCEFSRPYGPDWCHSSWNGHSGWLSSHFLLGEDTGAPPN